MDITSHFKKGYTTTEFWLSVVGAIVAVASVFGVELDAQVLAGFAPVAAYVLGRSYLKGKRAEALGAIESEQVAGSAVGSALGSAVSSTLPPARWDLGLDTDD